MTFCQVVYRLCHFVTFAHDLIVLKHCFIVFLLSRAFRWRRRDSETKDPFFVEVGFEIRVVLVRLV